MDENVSVAYKDKDWLERQYLGLKKSANTIALAVQRDPETIRQWLIRFGIERRPAAVINHVFLRSQLMDILSGSLLGDGSIVPGKRGASPRYSISNKHRAYLQYVSSNLEAEGLEQCGKITRHDNEWGTSWNYHSRHYPELQRLRDKWYPDGKKHVPSDIILNPTTTRVWFIEDGYFGQMNDLAIGRIQFATNSFTEEETGSLAGKLQIALDDKRVHVNKGYPSGWTIVFSRREVVEKFFSYIGGCPDKLSNIYGYKWPTEVAT